uniref:Keratin n=1 Tax=Anas platyrhynchos TaxID=8839 RepID=A0A8B9TF62_ANAPL
MTVRQMKMRLFQALPLGDTVVDKVTENCLKYKKTTDYLLCFSPLRDPLLLVGRGNLNLAEVVCQHRYVLLTYPLREGPFYQSSGEKSEDKEAFCMELPGSGASPAQDMSCYNQCLPCRPCGPTPLASSCNEPCVRQCQNSTVVIEPSPVVVTLPGPILSSFPQNTVVGSSTSAAVGSILSCDGVPITSSCCDLSGISSRYCGRRCLP